MARQGQDRSWLVMLFRKRGEPAPTYLGVLEAPDREAADQEAVERFKLTDEQCKRLVLTALR